MSEDLDSPHSAAYFGDERDLWWNADYVELLARRFDLAHVQTVLDVGAGLGHWGAVLRSVIAPDAQITGVEREPRWVELASEHAQASGEANRLRFEQGVAENLRFPDDTFDLVTCQTLLIHVADPGGVVAEMVRVARPGGLVLVAEPNNRASLLVETNVSATGDVERKAEAVRFGLILEHGKRLLGEGDSSVGDLVPGLFAEAGLERIECFVADKAALLVPPYGDAEQQVLKQAWVERARANRWLVERSDAERYFAAGGGDQAGFDALWERRLAEARDAVAALEAGSLHGAGGVIHYVVAGRKRTARAD